MAMIDLLTTYTNQGGGALRRPPRWCVPHSLGWQRLGAGDRVAKVLAGQVGAAKKAQQDVKQRVVHLAGELNGRTVRSGPLSDPHIGIDPSTIRPGNIP